jgi:hypothetical protein
MNKLSLFFGNIISNYWFLLAGLLIANKTVNLNKYFGISKVNNFLDLVVSGYDVILWGVFVYMLAKFLVKLIRSQDLFFKFGGFLLIFGFLAFPFGNLGLFLQFMRFVILVVIGAQVWNSPQHKLESRLVLAIIFVYSLFDHLLVTSSLPAVLVLVFFGLSKVLTAIKHNIVIDRVVFGIVTVNLALAIWQVIVGRSFGLGIIGEPVVDINTYSQVAKQIVNSTLTVLRGYGLTQHPNILGFVGTLGFLYSYSSSKFGKILRYLSLFVVLFSFSRIAWICVLMILIVHSYRHTIEGKLTSGGFVVSYIIRYAGFAFLLGLFFSRKDVHRFFDLELWYKSFVSLDLKGKLFGAGYYPEFLLSRYSNLEVWQWQPVHNLWLNVLFEFGIIGTIIIIGGTVFAYTKSK